MSLLGSNRSPRWRVFVSHTSELRDFPISRSYVWHVERAISATGHVTVDMADFPATGQPPAELCVERVRSCDVYVGILGTRYGSPVRNKANVSYTELEFNTATEAGMPRLMFLLDVDTDSAGIPVSALIDRVHGAQQDGFRSRVLDSGVTTQSFSSPAELGQLVERSLRELQDQLLLDQDIELPSAAADFRTAIPPDMDCGHGMVPGTVSQAAQSHSSRLRSALERTIPAGSDIGPAEGAADWTMTTIDGIHVGILAADFTRPDSADLTNIGERLSAALDRFHDAVVIYRSPPDFEMPWIVRRLLKKRLSRWQGEEDDSSLRYVLDGIAEEVRKRSRQ